MYRLKHYINELAGTSPFLPRRCTETLVSGMRHGINQLEPLRGTDLRHTDPVSPQIHSVSWDFQSPFPAHD